MNTLLDGIDGVWRGQEGDIAVAVCTSHSVRDLRAQLVALAYQVRALGGSSMGVCIASGTRLTEERMNAEITQFRRLLDGSLATRLHIVRAQDGRLSGPFDTPEAFQAWALEILREEFTSPARLMPAQQLVVSALAQMRMANAPPSAIKDLQAACQASYPTVAKVLTSLGARGLLEDLQRGQGVRFRPLDASEWMDLATDHARHRQVVLYADPTRLMTPTRLAHRAMHLLSTGALPRAMRIGGVVGAAHHFPSLDITAPRRLDITAPSDPDYIADRIDAGLVRTQAAKMDAVVAIHLEPVRASQPGSYAGWLECLADLIELGYIAEAREMAYAMERINRQG